MIEVTSKHLLEILLCAPRGFCAGVERAVQIVELALRKFGPPVFVRHEIVHNRYVIEGLTAKGAIFVEDLSEIPDTEQPVIFSAHGVAKEVTDAARARALFLVDATCPLVSKVHHEAEIHFHKGRHALLVGHAGHPEVIGTVGQLPPGAMTLIESEVDAWAFRPKDPTKLAWITQTTLSVDDTAAIIKVLTKRFPNIVGPGSGDICYATTNRQAAVKRIAASVEAIIVVGAPHSSNSRRLCEVALRAGCPAATLVQRADEIDWPRLQDIRRLGITSGASAPEVLVEEVIDALAARFNVHVEVVRTAEEAVAFNLPRVLRETTTT
jgi:4-hydroxy-3-methylbut-2-en-1-yl diphosphate reductase